VSLRSVNLGKLLREAPESPGAATVPLNLKGILTDVDTPATAGRASARDRKNVARWAGVVVIVGVLLATLLAVLKPTIVTLFTSAIPASSRTQSDAPKPAVEPSAFSKPVQELTEYVQCLKGQLPNRGCGFRADITGEEAAKQLGYSRLFASAYEEMILRVKAGEKAQAPVGRDDVIAGFDNIVGEEQAIDQLMAHKERYTAAIAYLRALQNGDAAFPAPQVLAPTPPVLLVQLMSAYPDVALDINDPVFAVIYRRTRDFAAARVSDTGEVLAQEIIAEFRRLILQSATSRTTDLVPTSCERASTIGALAAITSSCPRLHLARAIMTASDQLAQVKSERECKEQGRTELATKLNAMSAGDMATTCDVIERNIRAGDISTLEIDQ